MTTTLKLKLEPQCTPNPAGNCFTYSRWFYSSEYTDLTWRPFLELDYYGPTPTPTRTPTSTPTLLQLRPTRQPSADGDVYTDADMDGWAATPTPHTPTATPTAIPGLVISEVGANPVNTDWNGDGLIDERDRFAEVCNWTGATIDFDDNYWMTYNGGSTDLFNGEILAGQCAVFWFDLSGRDFRPYPPAACTNSGTVTPGWSARLANTGAADRCYQRYLGSGRRFAARCTPAKLSGYWLTHLTPTPTPQHGTDITGKHRNQRSGNEPPAVFRVAYRMGPHDMADRLGHAVQPTKRRAA